MLDEGSNSYVADADADSSRYVRRVAAVRSAAVQNPATNPAREGETPVASIKAPTTAAGLRDFDFAAAMFNDEHAWRELARSIARDAA